MNLLIPFVTVAVLAAAQHPNMPSGMSHEDHLKQMQKDAEMKRRGAEAMGFDQDVTTHHFRLAETGGSIEVTVKDKSDEQTIAAIRGHLRSIAGEFAAGRFDKPFQTHGEVPPGVVEMQSSRQRISYRYQDLPQGGVVRMETTDAPALAAIHSFLRYQITEHHTGDSLQSRR